jgi:hypothetical protein
MSGTISSPISTAAWSTTFPEGSDIVRIAISRGPPRGHPAGYRMYRSLAPPWWYRSVTATTYVRRYAQEVLGQLDAREVVRDLLRISGGRPLALLCFERPMTNDGWCHRSLALGALASYADTFSPLARFYSNTIVLFFAAGIVVALIQPTLQQYSIRASLFAFLFAFAALTCSWLLLTTPPAHHATLYTLTAIAFALCTAVLTIPSGDTLWQRLIVASGNASYSTYLFHGFFIFALKPVTAHLPTGDYLVAIIYAAAVVVLGNGLGLLVHRYLEAPLTRYFHNS